VSAASFYAASGNFPIAASQSSMTISTLNASLFSVAGTAYFNMNTVSAATGYFTQRASAASFDAGTAKFSGTVSIAQAIISSGAAAGTLSALTIDSNKDWLGYSISNMGSLGVGSMTVGVIGSISSLNAGTAKFSGAVSIASLTASSGTFPINTSQSSMTISSLYGGIAGQLGSINFTGAVSIASLYAASGTLPINTSQASMTISSIYGGVVGQLGSVNFTGAVSAASFYAASGIFPINTSQASMTISSLYGGVVGRLGSVSFTGAVSAASFYAASGSFPINTSQASMTISSLYGGLVGQLGSVNFTGAVSAASFYAASGSFPINTSQSSMTISSIYGGVVGRLGSVNFTGAVSAASFYAASGSFPINTSQSSMTISSLYAGPTFSVNGTAYMNLGTISGATGFFNVYASGASLDASKARFGGFSAASAAENKIVSLNADLFDGYELSTVSGWGGALPSPAYRTIVLTAPGGTIPATSGCSGPYQYTTTNANNYMTLEFANGVTRYAEWTVTMPDNWDGGTIYAQFLWFVSIAGTGNTTWGIFGRTSDSTESLDVVQSSAAEVTQALATVNADTLYKTSDATLTVQNTPAGGHLLQIKVYRKGASDTMNRTAKLLMVRLKYVIDSYSDV